MRSMMAKWRTRTVRTLSEKITYVPYVQLRLDLARMDENAMQVILEPSPESCRRQPGWPRTTWMKTIQGDLCSLDLELHDARELTQNRPLWRRCLCRPLWTWCMLLLDWIRLWFQSQYHSHDTKLVSRTKFDRNIFIGDRDMTKNPNPNPIAAILNCQKQPF